MLRTAAIICRLERTSPHCGCNCSTPREGAGAPARSGRDVADVSCDLIALTPSLRRDEPRPRESRLLSVNHTIPRRRRQIARVLLLQESFNTVSISLYESPDSTRNTLWPTGARPE